MIWYVGLLICTILSFWLALRSMRDFQEAPISSKDSTYGLFLLRNPVHLSQSVFASLMKELRGVIVSFEHIQRGDSSVLVAFLPSFVTGKFPSLGLTEIEDYIEAKDAPLPEEFIRSRQISLNDSFAWSLLPKKKGSPILEKSAHLRFDLKPEQYSALQIVAQSSEQGIQINARIMVKEKVPQSKIELIKQVKEKINLKTTLTNNPSLLHPAVFEDYKKRASVPRHAQPFIVKETELLEFLKN